MSRTTSRFLSPEPLRPILLDVVARPELYPPLLANLTKTHPVISSHHWGRVRHRRQLWPRLHTLGPRQEPDQRPSEIRVKRTDLDVVQGVDEEKLGKDGEEVAGEGEGETSEVGKVGGVEGGRGGGVEGEGSCRLANGERGESWGEGEEKGGEEGPGHFVVEGESKVGEGHVRHLEVREEIFKTSTREPGGATCV